MSLKDSRFYQLEGCYIKNNKKNNKPVTYAFRDGEFIRVAKGESLFKVTETFPGETPPRFVTDAEDEDGKPLTATWNMNGGATVIPFSDGDEWTFSPVCATFDSERHLAFKSLGAILCLSS